MKTITSQKQVIDNIQHFNREVYSSLQGAVDENVEVLIKNIPHYRAWYCYFDENANKHLYAPSKYIGYSEIDAPSYCEYNRNGLDGRQTESALSAWYETISDRHEQFESLSEKLREFCSKFDKKPNSLFRINISPKKPFSSTLEDTVVEFIWNAYQNLSGEKRLEIKNKINRYRD